MQSCCAWQWLPIGRQRIRLMCWYSPVQSQSWPGEYLLSFRNPHLSGPQHFQAILNLSNAFHLADRFLGHLLLEIRLYRSLQHHSAAVSLEPQQAAVHMRVGLNGLIDAVG